MLNFLIFMLASTLRIDVYKRQVWVMWKESGKALWRLRFW